MEDTIYSKETLIPEKTEEVWKSNKLDKLAQALTKAQAEIKGALSQSTNPFFNSSYADLHTVIKASLPALTAHGLSVVQGNRFCASFLPPIGMRISVFIH